MTCASTPVIAATWYVDGSAQGAKTGQSWPDAWTTVAAVKGLSPGDTVYISGGPNGSSQTYEMNGSWKLQSGAPGNPVTYKIGQDELHNGVAVLHSTSGQGPWIDAAVSGKNNLHDIIVSGDAGDGRRHFQLSGFRTVFYVNNGSFHRLNWYLGYVDFGNLATCGSLQSVNKFELDHCKWIIDDLAVNNSLAIQFRGSTWKDNQIHHCDISVPGNGDGLGGDFIAGGGKGISIYNNTFTAYVAKYTGTQHQDGWQSLGGSYLEIYNNTFSNIANYSIFLEAFYGDFSHVRIYNNIVRNTLASVQASHAPRGIMVVPTGGVNVLKRLGRWPLFDDIIIANNLIVDLGGTHAAIQLQNQSSQQKSSFTRCQAYNNIYVNGGGFSFDPAVATAHNIGFTSARAARRAFRSYAPQDPANDFRLGDRSSLLPASGTNLSAYFGTDKNGAARPSDPAPWTIGPYERVAESR